MTRQQKVTMPKGTKAELWEKIQLMTKTHAQEIKKIEMTYAAKLRDTQRKCDREIGEIERERDESINLLAEASQKLSMASKSEKAKQEKLDQIRDAVQLLVTLRWPQSSLGYECDKFYVEPNVLEANGEEPEGLRAMRYLYKLATDAHQAT